ncbi:hypothetical protein B0H10DRAFT_2333880 [Mycena sp. CBHHK59/15]|nr:hypothetical protein B0H10DRAFT_2333880 [Mycena sp. CBHHK59/15]
MSGKEATSAWYWTYLVQHPDASSKVKAVRDRGRRGDKPKVYCKAHLEADIRDVRDIDRANGAEARTDGEIAATLWSKPHTLRQGWMIGNTVTMLNHLKNCTLVPQAVRERASQNPNNAGTGFSSPSKRCRSTEFGSGRQNNRVGRLDTGCKGGSENGRKVPRMS